MKRHLALALTLVLTAASAAFAQAPTADPDSFKAAGFTAANLYQLGFTLKEMNPVTPAHSEMAAKALWASAALGNPNAYALLAEMYLGNRIPPDAGQTAGQEAMKYMQMAWDKGSTTGYADLGLLYYNVAIPGVNEETPRGATVSFVPRDYDKAFQYFSAACEKGSFKSCRWVGICYEDGTCATKDLDKAVKSYQKAAGRDGTAQFRLASMMVAGRGMPQDVPRAMATYQAEIDRKGQDAGVSAYAMGQIYEKGITVPVDKDKAIAYYQIAAADGIAEAKPAVDAYAAGLYRDGYAQLKAGKYDSALPLLVKAADLGNADALKLTGKK